MITNVIKEFSARKFFFIILFLSTITFLFFINSYISFNNSISDAFGNVYELAFAGEDFSISSFFIFVAFPHLTIILGIIWLIYLFNRLKKPEKYNSKLIIFYFFGFILINILSSWFFSFVIIGAIS